ncbi:MAG: C-GCAxxG-C-C family protein [Halobacteriota archaeon]
MTKADDVVALYGTGFNCAQALLSVFAPDYGLDRDTALRLAQGLGAGISRTDNLCGQVSSPVMIIGLRYGGTRAEDTAAREKTFQIVGEFIREFTRRNGAVDCTVLLGYNLSDPQQAAKAKERKVMPARCPGFIRDAVEILEDLL